MDKIRSIDGYVNTVRENSDFFKSYYFHSLIDLNLVKLDAILRNGILCKNLIQQKGLVNLFTHAGNDLESKNGNTYVSLSKYTDNTMFNSLFESFPYHTLTSLSILVNRGIFIEDQGEREPFFNDEVFRYGSIPTSEFEGIILPEHLSTMPISEVNCLPDDLSCYTKAYIRHWIKCMQSYFNTSIPLQKLHEINKSCHNFWKILKRYEDPSRWINYALGVQRDQCGEDIKDVLANTLQYLWSLKFQIDNPTYMDVLLRINDGQLPVYEIKQETLKRVI